MQSSPTSPSWFREQVKRSSPLTVSPEITVADAIALLRALPVNHCAVVTSENRVLGVLTERDALCSATSQMDVSQAKVSDFLSQPAVTLTLSNSANVFTALELMQQHRICCLPVVNAQGLLIGLVTQDWLNQAILESQRAIQSSAMQQRPHRSQSRSQKQQLPPSETTPALEPETQTVHSTLLSQYEVQDSVTDLQHLLEDLHQQNQALRHSRLLLESERQRYQDLFEFAPDGYLVTDLDSVIQEANRAIATMLAVPDHYLVGKPLSLFVVPKQRRTFLAQLPQLERVQNWEIGLRSRAGAALTVMAAVTRIYDAQGQTIGLRWLLRDISDRKALEHQLRSTRNELKQQVKERASQLTVANTQLQHEIQYSQNLQHQIDFQLNILAQISDAVVASDQDGRITYWNQAAERLYGFRAETVLGRTVEEVQQGRWLNPQDEQIASRCLETDGFWQGENIHINASGDIIYVESSVSVIRGDDGDPIGLLATIRDVGDRKLAELALQQQTAQEQLIAEIAQHIRQSLNLTEVLGRTVERVRQVLQADRTIIFRFQADWRGTVVMESVDPTWPSMLSTTIYDPCFAQRYIDLYRQGHTSAIANLDAPDVNPCLVDLLKTFQIKASLVVPILQGDNLWGLLIAHHCAAPRDWQIQEIDLLQQLSTQVGIAIQQSELYQQTHRELIERKRMQDALLESEERFRLLSTNAPVGICQANADGICLYTNVRWQEMSGLSLEQCLGDGWLQSVHPQDRKAVVAAWETCLRDRTSFRQEFRLLTPQREMRWISGQVTAIQTDDGEIKGYVGIYEDITERKQVEAALRQSEALYRSLIESQTDLLVRIDGDGRITFANTVTCQTFGFEADSVLGQSLLDVVHPDDLHNVLDNLHRLTEPPHRLTTSPQRAFTVNGVRWFQWEVAAIRDASGLFTEIQGVGRDITEYKQAEQKIREQAALIDIATDAIFVQDLDQSILFWSQGAERLYGWTAAEAVGQKTSELFDQTRSDTIQPCLETTIEQGGWQGEMYQTTRLRSKIVVSSRWTLVKDEIDRPKSILVVNTDITEKKQLEAQFFRAQRLESIGTLASGIAHDLNNIFTPIMAIAQLLPIKVQPLDDDLRELLDSLTNSTRRGADLVKQVLTFARGTEGKRILLQPGHLLLEIVRVLRQTFPKSIEIHAHISPTALWLVSADPTQLHQVFMNLCVNARDAMPDGGTISITAENLMVDEMFARMYLEAREGAYVVITVSDTGTGIPVDLLDRIFDPFFTTKTPGQGTGLGLSTVLGIVKNYGGFVQVLSEVGQGTHFKIYLPAIEAHKPLPTEALDLPSGQGELILVVDDEAPIRDTTRMTLETYKYRVLTASDGIEAIAQFAQHHHEIRVVLVDMMMPTMDGIMTIRTLQKIDPNIAFIAMSGLASNYHQAIKAAGIKNVLWKPFTTSALLQTVREVLHPNADEGLDEPPDRSQKA